MKVGEHVTTSRGIVIAQRTASTTLLNSTNRPSQATRRSEFAAILKAEGIDGLIAALNRKPDILTGTSTRAL